MSHIPPRAARGPALALACVVLAGCASFSSDGGFDRVSSLARDRLDKRAALPVDAQAEAELDRQVDALLAQPLTADAAVQVALLDNRGLRATLRELGIAEADLVQAGRLPNPGFEFKRTREGSETIIERTYLVNLAALVMMPLVARMERSRFAETQLVVTDALLRTAAGTRRAWVDAVAAEGRVRYASRVVDASEAASLLAGRMRAAGNWSALEAAREQAFHADAVAELARTRQASVQARERLTRLLGLDASTRFTLPERLPDPPEAPLAIADAEAFADAHRIDLEADRAANRRLAEALGVADATRVVNAFEVARDVNDRTDRPRERGYEIRIEVPLFDFGDARVAKARAIAQQAIDRTAQHAIDARSEVRERHLGYRTAWDTAKHYRDVVVPLRKRISDETLLRYNGMLVGVFELIADAREQTAAVIAALEAERAFWLAEADLAEALGGRLPASTTQAANGGAR